MAVAFLESGVARATANLADCAGPEPEDFPDDAEIADWETQRADLTRQLASVRESRMEAIRLREQTRLAAVEAADLLSALTRSEQNLYAKATGERVSLTAFEGGVTRVA